MTMLLAIVLAAPAILKGVDQSLVASTAVASTAATCTSTCKDKSSTPRVTCANCLDKTTGAVCLDEDDTNTLPTLGDVPKTLPAKTFFNSSTCTDIQTVDMPFVKAIWAESFFNQITISSINIPSVLLIGEAAFGGIEKMTKIDMPKVRYIGPYAFYMDKNLASVHMPSMNLAAAKKAAKEHTGAFKGAEGYLEHPKMAEAVFYGCDNLTSVTGTGTGPVTHGTDMTLKEQALATKTGSGCPYGLKETIMPSGFCGSVLYWEDMPKDVGKCVKGDYVLPQAPGHNSLCKPCTEDTNHTTYPKCKGYPLSHKKTGSEEA